MSRRHVASKREILPDPKYGDRTVAKFINMVMSRGKKAVAEKIVEDTAFYLAIGATNVLHTIDPDMVVYAGGMVAAGESFLDRIRKHVQQIAFPVPAEKAKICYAGLGSDAGFIGAAACARQVFRKSR